MSIIDLVFQKGGIGVSLSREETAQRLNPLIKAHMELNHRYNDAIANLSDKNLADTLQDQQKIARVDVGKLMETVFSCGASAYNGVDLEPSDFSVGTDDDTILFALLDAEKAFQENLAQEDEHRHQIRTKAVLSILQTNGQSRLDLLKKQTASRRRK